ncbi:MAG: NupC/NupG family nucleoside CNT transporter [bacterium]|nr:NupC/NupG family nucleoside CNT transporter [bacterium]
MLNLVSLLGLLTMILLAWLMSSYRSRVNWRLVTLGIMLQIAFAGLFFNSQNWRFPRSFESFDALLAACEAGECQSELVPSRLPGSFAESFSAYERGEISKSEFESQYWDPQAEVVEVPRFANGIVFHLVESFFNLIQRSVEAGSRFVFETHPGPDDQPPTHPLAVLTTFAFGVLPTVIFFAALMSVLYYLGIMQRIVRGMAWLMQRTLGTSASESLAAAANVLVGHTEAPLVVKPYVPSMTRSELNALMVGGFATISGSLMAVFANLGISAGHLLTASIISAPAALVIAKILQPEVETPTELAVAEQSLKEGASNVIEAAANGATEGMKLAINIAAMLIAFLALIAFADICLQSLGGLVGLDLSLSRIFGVLFFPIAWIMGIASQDCLIAGDLMGKKLVVNEFLAYIELAAVPDAAVDPENGISDRTRTILTYALCGFSNFGAIGIQLGGIGPLAPNRKSDLAQLGLRAMLGGALAACMTACIAGAFYGFLA